MPAPVLFAMQVNNIIILLPNYLNGTKMPKYNPCKPNQKFTISETLLA